MNVFLIQKNSFEIQILIIEDWCEMVFNETCWSTLLYFNHMQIDTKSLLIYDIFIWYKKFATLHCYQKTNLNVLTNIII